MNGNASVPVVTFFNSKGGVGTTALVYHLAWMMAGKGLTVVAADLDPQATLTAAFLDEPTLESLWSTSEVRRPVPDGRTVYGSLAPLICGTGDMADPQLIDIDDRLSLVPGDLALSTFEDELSGAWSDCVEGNERSFRVISAFSRLLRSAARRQNADIVLVDAAPNLGAINRSVMVATDHVVIPLAPDLFSVHGLRNLGPTLRRWRSEWEERLATSPEKHLELPRDEMRPRGYVLLQHGFWLGQPVTGYQRSISQIPSVYRSSVLGVEEAAPPMAVDPYCLSQLKHYRSLMPLAEEARKPVFHLKPADGAFGGHQAAVSESRAEFSALADRVLREVIPSQPSAVAGSATP